MSYQVNKSDIEQMHLKQQWKKNTQTTSTSPSKNTVEKKNKKSVPT